ncbi:hypothetical protein [Microvirga brassicacearum]|uniref:Uncharacterized protein n=1 Tax=Microvirga brassicacearum TaxID=2580413 RepID=A0A5N3PCA7_9HYPH|nr:hypothetical protein [Microvirga brassicacearum]KAB0267377.1 hypothetical protein FEZ63_08675 [Microvirga brassicacearum]
MQLLNPGSTSHTARLLGNGRWFLGDSAEWPGVIPADAEIANLNELAAMYPAVPPEMREIAASVRDMAMGQASPR